MVVAYAARQKQSWMLNKSHICKSGPIIVIDDDPEDHFIMGEIFRQLKCPNKVLFFNEGNAVVEYLAATVEVPFLIISDINMPGMDGFEIRNRIFQSERLGAKHIPYLFFTTTADKKAVRQAYDLSVQGFFIKPTTMAELEQVMRKIIAYWQECCAPSQFN